jgi:molybdopterin-binding protein
MHISARNQLTGTVKEIKLGDIMAEIIVTLPGNQEVASVITRTSADSLNLHEGDTVTVIIKSTEVMLGKDE